MVAMNNVGGAKFVINAVFNDDAIKDAAKQIQKDVKRAENAWKAFGDSMKRAERIQASFSDRWKAGFVRGVLTSVERGENSFQRLGNGVAVAGQAFEKIRNPVEQVAVDFQKLQRRGFSLQAGLGVLSSTLGSLAGGFLSLVGVAGQASGALYSVVGAISSFVAGGIAASFALRGVGQAVGQLWNGQEQYNQSLRDAKREFRDLRFQAEELALSEEEAAITLEKARETLARVQDLPPDNRVRREAELAYKQAELNYRKVKTAAQDTNKDIARGNRSQLNAIDPFKNLTESQKVFVKYLLTTKSAITQLKDAASGAFLPDLQVAIQGLISKALPTLIQGLKDAGSGMGAFVKRLSGAFQTPENLQNLGTFFKNTKTSLDLFGKAAASGVGAFLELLVKIQPLTDQLARWLDTYAKRLGEYFDSQVFTDFLATSSMVATKLGDIFRDVFTGISNIMKASFPASGDGGGNLLLKWLKKVTDGFKNFTGSSDFANWLRDATDNATTALDTLGQFMRIFLDLADAPQTKEFWTILRGAVEPVKSMLEAGVEAGPAFAKFLVAITKLFDIFLGDSGGMIIFFETLAKITDTVVTILTPLKDFIDFIGRIQGFFLAIGAAIIVFNKSMVIFSGIISLVLKSLGELGGRFTTLGSVTKKAYYAQKEYYWGLKAGYSGQLAFVRSLWDSYKGTEKLKTGLEGAKSKFGIFNSAVKDARVNLKNGFGSTLDGIGKRFTTFGGTVQSASKTMSTSLGKTMDTLKTKSSSLIKTLRGSVARATVALASATLPGYGIMPAAPKDSRRMRNRAMMADVASGGSMPMSTVHNREMEAEQAAATARVGIRQRMLNAMERMDLEKSVKFNALQTKYFAHQDKLYAEGYVYKRGMMWKPFYEYKVFLKSQLAADMQYYARRAKANIMNPTWLTGPIKRAAKASADYTVAAVREGKYRVYIAKEETKEYLAGVGKKIAKESQWVAYRMKHNLRNPTWILNEVKAYASGVKQKIAALDVFDTKRRASALENIRNSATNLKYTVRESKAYEAVGTAVDKAKGKLASLAAATRARFSRGAGGAAADAGPTTGRQFVTDQMATMRAGNMPSAGNPFAASPANSQIASSIAGTAKTVAQQKAMESSYTSWWSSQLTLRARIKRQLDIRGLAEENQSLGVRLTNVARSYALEAAAIGAVKRTQLKANIANIAAETKEYAAATAHKLKYEARYRIGLGLRGLAQRRLTVADLKHFISTKKEELAQTIAVEKAKAQVAMDWFKYRAKANFMNPTWFTGPLKTIQNRVGNSMKSLWGNVRTASLDAAKQSRLSWARSLGASQAELKKLAAELQKVKTKAELKSNSLIGSMTPGYGGVRGTLGRANAKYGMGAAGFGMAASMMGPQPSTPGIGSAISGVGMVASMIPGGQLIGAGASIVGAIVGGFEAAAEKEKARKAAEKQKKIEIKAEMAQINAENLDQARGGVHTLINTYNKSFAEAGKILEDFTTGVSGKITDTETAFTNFAPFLTGSLAERKKLTKTLGDATQNLMSTGAFADEGSVTAELARIMKEGFRGVTGAAAIKDYTDQFKDKKTGQFGRFTSTGVDAAGNPTGPAKVVFGNAATEKDLRSAAGEMVTEINPMLKTLQKVNDDAYARLDASTAAALNERFGRSYKADTSLAASDTILSDVEVFKAELLAQKSTLTKISTGKTAYNAKTGLFAGQTEANRITSRAAGTAQIAMPAAMVSAQTKNAVNSGNSLKIGQQTLISTVAQERHLSNLVKLTRNKDDKTAKDFNTQAFANAAVKGTTEATPYLPYSNTALFTGFN